MTKDQWIQKVKALLFDLTFLNDDALRPEIEELIEQGGGYDSKTECSTTELRWPQS